MIRLSVERRSSDGIVGPRTRAALQNAGGTASKPQPAPAPSTLRNKIVSVARGQIGVTEGSSACNKYLAGTGQTCKVGWCAAFSEWTWRQAGVKSVPADLTGRGVGYWGKEHGLFHERGGYTPKPGDLVVYGPPAKATPGGHVGVVVAVNSDGISGYVTPPGA